MTPSPIARRISAYPSVVSYADFVLVSALHMFKRVDQALLYDRVVSIEPALGLLYNASKAWLERDDH